jgi:hypothetical protein
MSPPILTDVVAEAGRILDSASGLRAPLRLLGGVAVRVHAHDELPPALARTYADIDLATEKKGGPETLELLESLGYVPNERFNALNGALRLLVYDLEHDRQVDVFVGEFEMCHRIPLDRLALEKRTIPLAELLLTKLQIVQLNPKDMRDVWAVLLFHDVGDHDDETVNAEVVARRLAADWGLWRTTRGNVERLREGLAGSGLSDLERAAIDDRLLRLWERVEREPKSLRWRSRAKLGDRTRWYEEPEEVQRSPSG